jgi:hypothetical protein
LIDERQVLHLHLLGLQLQQPEKQSQHQQPIQDKFKHRIQLHEKCNLCFKLLTLLGMFESVGIERKKKTE